MDLIISSKLILIIFDLNQSFLLLSVLPMMTAVPDRRLVIQDPTLCWCQAATASSLQKERLLRCSTLLMSSATTPLDLTCPPPRLLPLMSRDSWRILPRSMETSSTRLSWMTDSGLLEDYSQTIVQYMLVKLQTCYVFFYTNIYLFI